MPKNTVHGGGSYAGHSDIPLNPDGERAVAEGRLPDRDKSAFIGREVTEDEYTDAMSRHGKDEFSAEDKMVVQNWHAQRGTDKDQADQITGDADTRDSKTTGKVKDTGGVSSPGKTSSPSSDRQQKNDASAKSDRPSTARTTDTRSSKAQTASGSASSTAGSGKANE